MTCCETSQRTEFPGSLPGAESEPGCCRRPPVPRPHLGTLALPASPGKSVLERRPSSLPLMCEPPLTAPPPRPPCKWWGGTGRMNFSGWHPVLGERVVIHQSGSDLPSNSFKQCKPNFTKKNVFMALMLNIPVWLLDKMYLYGDDVRIPV